MPKETHGGDDTGEAPEGEVKKPRLDKFRLGPDKNIRDIFWAILASYATRKSFDGIDSFKQDRFAFMKIAFSIITSPHQKQYGMGPSLVTRYSMMMCLDGKWKDAFRCFLQEAMESKPLRQHVVKAMKYLLRKQIYKGEMATILKEMMRSRKEVSVALNLIAFLKNRELNSALEKEIIIFARGDVGENQMNALSAMETIREDRDIKKTFITLLSHWDPGIRLRAAKVLKKMKKDKEVCLAAKKRLKEEAEEPVKSVLKMIAK